jgi:hypothetical protein
MTRNIIITTPKGQAKTAAKEAQDVIKAGGGYYFRKFSYKINGLGPDSKVFYVLNGHIRGYCVIEKFEHRDDIRCQTTGRRWLAGWYAIMRADSWKWIRPIPMGGFQGWRYADKYIAPEEMEPIGDWLDPMPKLEE